MLLPSNECSKSRGVNMDAMRILILGSSGYLGGRLMSAFRGRDIDTVGADLSLQTGSVDRAVDIRFPAQTLALIHSVNPSVVISLPYLGTKDSDTAPQAALDTNVAGVNGVFEAASQLKVPRVIYASSNVVCGDQTDFGSRDVDEDAPTRPRSLYAWMKVLNEAMADHYNGAGQTRLIGVRLSSLHGRGKGGIFNPVDLVADAAAGAGHVTLPWSRRHEFSFLHVDDAAQVFVELALSSNPRWTLYHSPGERVNMEMLAKVAAQICPLEIDFEEPGRQLAHISRIGHRRFSDEFAFRPRALSEWIKLEIERRVAASGTAGNHSAA